MFRRPLPVLALASRRMLTPEITPRALALATDVAIVRANADRQDDFARITSPTLLVDGTATMPYLRRATAALAAVIPNARRLTLPGERHAATQNRSEYGNPDAVVAGLREFLG